MSLNFLRWFFVSVVLGSIGLSVSAQTNVVPAGWQAVQLNNKVAATVYNERLWDGVKAIEARANSSMTLLVKQTKVDVLQTPVACWAWRTEQRLLKADMLTKQGDDFAARLYVSVSLPSTALSLATRAKLAIARNLFGQQVPDAAISYVWDNRYPIGQQALNAYTDRVMMIALQNHETALSRWVEQRRDVLADLQASFGAVPLQVSLVGWATDTDNTQESMHAGYAGPVFVKRDQACPALGAY
jgi:Protein of unknown function (DUF3047)